MTFIEIYKVLEIVSALVVIIPFIIYLITRKKLGNIYNPLGTILGFSIIAEIISFFLAQNGINNYFVFRIFTFLEMILISIFYSYYFKHYFKSWVLLAPIPLFFMISIVDYKINGVKNFDNYSTSFEALTFSIISLWSLYFIMKKMMFNNITAQPFFWINTGILLYFGGNLILFVFNAYLLKQHTSEHLAMWTIHSLLNIVYNILISIGFWKIKRQ